MLREIVPSISKIAVLINPGNKLHRLIVANEIPHIAQTLGLALPVVEASFIEELQSAFASAVAQNAAAMVVFADTILNRPRVANLTVEHRLPAISLFRMFPENGGLMSYGPDLNDSFRRGAFYIDKILKGIKPTDLPIQQPTKFDLVINLKPAKALGITIPNSLLTQATELIE